jgi:hypothetical protein
MILKHLIKLLQNLDPNSEITDFDIYIDDMHLSIKDTEKTATPDDTQTKTYKRADLLK